MNQALCEKCLIEAEVVEVGTASGRRQYRCPNCGRTWREKNLAASALGAAGGRKAAENLTQEERTSRAEDAANARWRKAKHA